ncbi:hypothetical protein T440DRAFT_228068 [Plenodomus tracheiphilus IPT5]|uniref:Apple domain-containing protein n=1 Tax=Plenodomus tracheiphilus IPT5 TaxID=1408161 RepID=A0A6A7AU15_9PLEO|nr:hypothetical protein T440DRAFT_228068 [Plenodomus tracheiphilus IPT5]
MVKLDNFQVVCGKILYGADFVQESAISLQDCITKCDLKQGCKAVTFDPNPDVDYKGCFMKNDISKRVDDNTANDSALLLPTDVTDDCTNLRQEIDANGKRYNLHCGNDYPGDDLPSVHAQSLNDCVGKCAVNEECKSVSFDPYMAVSSMYWNCYLKSSAKLDKLVIGGSTMHSALVVSGNSSDASAVSTSITPSSTMTSSPASTNTGSTLPANNDAKPASSKAWIAGAVVGPVAGIALVAALYFFLFKRGRRNRAGKVMPSELPQQDFYGGRRDEKMRTHTAVAPSYYEPQELDDGQTGRRELAGHPVAQLQ